MAQSSTPCAFLQLPPELRNEIYTTLFRSTTITSRGKPASHTGPYALALLRTCRHLYHETRRLWLGQVLLSYDSPKTFVERLPCLPIETQRQIRHLSIGRPQMPLQCSRPGGFGVQLKSLICMSPMTLETFTICADGDSFCAYFLLESMIRAGTGWQKLRFVLSNEDIISLLERLRMWSDAPEARWQAMLSKRDGENAGSSVKIYHALWASPHKHLFDPDSRSEYIEEETHVAPGRQESSNEKECSGLAGEDEWEAIMVVARRGRMVDITH